MATFVRPLRMIVLAGGLGLLAACSQRASTGGWVGARGHGYAAPGPASDPWGPYIRQASARFHVPERWVRAVMHQESGGHQFLNGRPTTSWAGAAGLMQVMPGTYAELSARYGLGPDPYDPYDNIMAGTAYIREMYDKYGSPGFLAAYNAGPGRMDAYLARGGALPSETVNYVASISPNLGEDSPESAAPAPAPRQYAAATPAPDLTPIPPSYVEPVPASPPAPVPVAVAASVPVAAPTPTERQAASLLGHPAAAAPAPAPPPAFVAPAVPRAAREPDYRLVAGKPYADMVSGAAVASHPASGPWAIQVGALISAPLARLATEGARQGANLLGGEATVTRVITPKGSTLYRARLEGLSQSAARAACVHLRAIGSVCDVIPPAGGA
jgi:hypothetical protein